MYSFRDDYSELGHEKVLKSLLEISASQLTPYGCDAVSAEAKRLIAERFRVEADGIFFLSGGTQTNSTFINYALSAVEAVIAADSGHICVHETGAIEHNGNKVITVKDADGKVLPAHIERVCAAHTDEHMVKPKLVYVSQPTEKGTVYSAAELAALYGVCQRRGLYLYIDGARLGAALTCGVDFTPECIAGVCDAFYIGGTKNGSPIGEALCIANKNLRKDFRYHMKQHGALLAKGSLIGCCFKALFTDGLFFELAKRANSLAQKIAKACIAKGYKMYSDCPANLIFPVLPDKKIAGLQKHFEFHIWEKIGADNSAVRIVCSWVTAENEVEKLISAI